MSRRPVSALALALLTSAALLTGCGTGLEARTYQEVGREDGAAASVGGRSGIAIRHLHVAPPSSGQVLEAGATALVVGGLVNNGPSADALVGAASDVAGAVTLLVDGSPTTEVALPAKGAAPQSWALALTGLNRGLPPATYVTVTLEFAHAGRVTLQVPVHAGDQGLDDREEAQDPYEAE
ncbi:MAG TPA: copper chaperone PCu(A)C [Mycobacteriales bacterium]|nr:copper chaperone PCu(A)C [Mycobacteriales bacterium]